MYNILQYHSFYSEQKNSEIQCVKISTLKYKSQQYLIEYNNLNFMYKVSRTGHKNGCWKIHGHI